MTTLRSALTFLNELLVDRSSENEDTLREVVATVSSLKAQMEAEISVQIANLSQDELGMLLQINDEVDTMLEVYNTWNASNSSPPKRSSY
jgi:hypothetical protein